MDFGIRGKKALVTGGSKGIGGAVAQALATEGCHVCVVARNEEKLRFLVDAMGGERAGHSYVVADLLELGRPMQVASDLLARNQVFDIVVHSIGGALAKKDPLGRVDDWNLVWRFNAGIQIEMNSLLIPPMVKQGWGRVIHISSISAEVGEPLLEPYGGALPYAAAKAYLNAYVRGLGRELAEQGIIVSALMPGAVLSEGKYWDKLRKSDPAFLNSFLERHQTIRRFGKPEEIAPFAVLLASQQASFAVGSIIPVSGGRI